MLTRMIDSLDLKQIAESGQCFRWRKLSENTYGLIAFGRYLEITQKGNQFCFSCGEDEFQEIWEEYLDLRMDYESIKMQFSDKGDVFLEKAVRWGAGIRILKQELWEVMISFIISQNNNIPRIRKNIEALCGKFGRPVYAGNQFRGYAFPAPEALSELSLADFKELGLGYRDKYIMSAAKWYVREQNRDVLRLLTCKNTEEQKSILKNGICGVGEKVANCILLFGLYKLDVCPVDTWMRKLIEEDYAGVRPVWMDSGYAGLYQQYAFYYKRERG